MPQENLVNIKLSDIESNPNRDLKFNPLNPDKVNALVSSILETGFWSNVILRPHPYKEGKYQLSYGHHRLAAAIQAGIIEAEFVVRELSEDMMLKIMELENSEDYRYSPLSLLESCKAVVLALADGRIAPFKARVGAAISNMRYAPSFIPKKHTTDPHPAGIGEAAYTAVNIGEFLGRTRKSGHKNGDAPQADPTVVAALDALYLLEVKAISTATIKNMNWSQLGRYVADAKAERERAILRKVKTAEEIKKLNADALRIQAEQRDKEKKLADERAALVKKEAEAKREADAKKAKEIKERIAEKDAQAEKVVETFEAKKAAIEAKVEEVKQKQVAMKQEDVYLPIRREAIRIIHLLERRDEEEQVKALSRRELNANDRELIRQAAIARGTWYLDFVAAQFLPPLSTKPRIKKESK